MHVWGFVYILCFTWCRIRRFFSEKPTPSEINYSDLLGLREKSYSVKQRNASSLKPCIGDVVIVKDNLPRKHWRIGRITSLPTSRDGNIRSAVVMLANNKSINRPLKILFPLETNTNGNNCTVDGPTNDTLEQRKQSGLPRREAFKKAKEKIKNVAISDRSDEGSDTNE